MTAKGFQWSPRREAAALLVARDELTNQQIADQLSLSYSALAKWKANPDFAARVESIVESMRKSLLKHGIADREARLAALDDRWRRMQRVIQARSREMANVPGGDSGLLARRIRMVKVYTGQETDYGNPADVAPHEEVAALAGDRVVAITEYVLDIGLLRALRDHERQASEEMGHWRDGGLKVRREFDYDEWREYIFRGGAESRSSED